jgi:septal ring factor EnvC (AmiA/AmiB activator)
VRLLQVSRGTLGTAVTGYYLVVRDEKGEIYTVRYEAVNAMLLNEFLKEHRQVQQLKATIAQQQEEFHSKFGQQQKQIEALTATVQKVRDQVALSKPAPQLAANP